jgi:hypothetical protein
MGKPYTRKKLAVRSEGLTLHRNPSREVVNAVLSDPWVAARLSQDGRQPGYIDHPLVSYAAAYANGELLGVFTAIQFTCWEVEVHVALLRHAIHHGRVAGREFLAQVFSDPDVLRVTAYVLATLPSAVNYCRRLGFVDEGCRRHACMVNAAPTDVLVLGMLRPAK